MAADVRLALVNLKIDRAKKHIRELDAEVRSFLDSNPYEIATRRDPQSQKLIYYVSKVASAPAALSIVAGDAIQNLRSALDHLAQQLFLTAPQSGGSERKIYFPIARNAGEFRRDLSGKIKGIRQEAVNAICALEPYGGGKGQDFWELHALNNIDKHRLVVTVGSYFDSMDIGTLMFANLTSIPIDVPIFIRPENKLCPLRVGDELFIDLPDAQENKQIRFRFNVALYEPDLCAPESLVEKVQCFADRVSNTVADFKSLLS